ncbi:alpha/beta hydrolase [Hyphomicrobium sp.]|uniref:alpha/beta hydrolase n=1 Tax=Hyphomicrobium sp. TaxID=82 RepID=UPI002FDF71F1
MSAPPPATAPAPEAAAPPPDENLKPGAPRDTYADRLEPSGGSSAEPSGGSGPPELSGGAAPDGGIGSFGQSKGFAERAREPAPPPPPSAAEAPPAAGSAPAGGAPPPAPAPVTAEAPKREQGEWEIVPVYYGTDRAEKPGLQRLDYGSERGRRLALGRALVTVPKAHKVPSIERPWAIRVFNITLYEEAEDPDRHFTMDEIKALTEDEFVALVRDRLKGSARYKDHAFIFVHGYNTSFDYAIYRTAQIAYDLKFDGAAFAYSWPSGGGLASYTYDRESSGQAEPYLREFVELVAARSGAKSVSIIAHSMGNQPMLQVLKDLRRTPPDGVRISQIVLAAPDVDRDNFENIARDIQGLASGVTLYAASNDRALTVSRNFYGGIPRAGDVPSTGPLVLPGIDTIDVSASSMDSLGLNHSGYAENNEILKDIAALIATGTRPPKMRTPTLEEVETAKGAYWRYPAARR